MNFWQLASDEPAGVLLHIHGGGWMGGKKNETLRPDQRRAGYHHASISYPLVNEGGQQPQEIADQLTNFILTGLKKESVI